MPSTTDMESMITDSSDLAMNATDPYTVSHNKSDVNKDKNTTDLKFHNKNDTNTTELDTSIFECPAFSTTAIAITGTLVGAVIVLLIVMLVAMFKNFQVKVSLKDKTDKYVPMPMMTMWVNCIFHRCKPPVVGGNRNEIYEETGPGQGGNYVLAQPRPSVSGDEFEMNKIPYALEQPLPYLYPVAREEEEEVTYEVIPGEQ